MLKTILEKIESIKEFKRITSNDKYRLQVYNSSINHDYLLTFNTFLSMSSSCIYVASNVYKATIAYENFVKLAGMENVNLYIMDDFVSSEVLATSNEYKYERIYTINSIINKEKKIIVTNIGALLREVMPIESYLEQVINLKTKERIDIEKIKERLVKGGYKRNYQVEAIGEFSLRGEVIDIYPINMTQPIRIDLFDDEIDYIKTFDLETQKTKELIDKVQIFPTNELIYDNSEDIISAIKSKVKTMEVLDYISQDLKDIEDYNISLRLLKYLTYFTKNGCCFLDYLQEKIVFYEEIKNCFEVEEKLNRESIDSLPQSIQKEIKLSLYLDLIMVLNKSVKNVYFVEFNQGVKALELDYLLDLKGYPIYDYKGNLASFALDLKDNKKTIVVGLASYDQKQLLQEVLKINGIKYNETNEKIISGEVNIIASDILLSAGFIEKDSSIEFVSKNNLFKKITDKEIKYRSSEKQVTINTKEDIAPMEYVVHYDYGIGQYLGIKTVELNGLKNDYLIIKYQNMDLYVPVENISLLAKYQGSEGVIPKLSKIGTNEWSKKKQTIKEKLEVIAGDLIRIEAIREKQEGYKYLPDDELQTSFENDFEYEETKDQEITIETIKRDMEAGKIIDRLVCGDVGYGKTEVAMRAAFKTVMNGKQVAYLAPTTILTRQHYYTFKERFEKYGVKVALINRFVSEAEISKTIKGLKEGTVDIVIGTHALLSDRLEYRDLGLLIVDEEQRFGVAHKEKIKQYKATINVLVLTATPIPRTLQMSLVGVRQLSLISTPPKNRYPIKTYVLEKNDCIIREAIYNELARGGQVFYLYNHINELDIVSKKLHNLVPEARIAIANGKMDKEALEDIVQSFIDKEYDILLCTTIIETGIDIPNTNTLIAERADLLGLAQMYQIRGRVGRSNRISYAYFIYDKQKVLNDNSIKRLNAIKEFTTLGSGYKIALRDLAIRGAGDILGKEQSGFIDTVGLDLYMKLLQEEINKIKGVKEQKEVVNTWNIEVSKHVDDSYVNDDEIKIYIHQRISLVTSKKEKEELIEELTDRFGSLNSEILTYIEKRYMDSLAKLKHVEKVKEYVSYVILNFTEEFSNLVDASELFTYAINITSSFSFEYKVRKIFVKLVKKGSKIEWMKQINAFLEQI